MFTLSHSLSGSETVVLKHFVQDIDLLDHKLQICVASLKSRRYFSYSACSMDSSHTTGHVLVIFAELSIIFEMELSCEMNQSINQRLDSN